MTKGWSPFRRRPPTASLCAAATLLGLALLFVSFATTRPWDPPGVQPGRRSDVATYRAIVSALRAGGGYYDVVGEELRRGGYATREAFNWRTPLLWSAIGRVPDVVVWGTLIGLAGLLWVGTFFVTVRDPLPAILADIMQGGTVCFSFVSTTVVMGETWAGILLGLSAVLYARRTYVGGALVGILALFVRELAAPFCVVCGIAALWRRRWQEFGTWVAGACLYGAYYGWHLVNVRAHRLPTDIAHASSWLELGGLPSLMSKAGWQGWLLLLPYWVTALATTLVCAGIAARRTPTHVRLAGGVYLVFFCLAGKPFDQYWGFMAWPIWSLACGYGLQYALEAWGVAVARPRRVREDSAA